MENIQYDGVTFVDGEVSQTTPVDADNLNILNNGIKAVTAMANALAHENIEQSSAIENLNTELSEAETDISTLKSTVNSGWSWYIASSNIIYSLPVTDNKRYFELPIASNVKRKNLFFTFMIKSVSTNEWRVVTKFYPKDFLNRGLTPWTQSYQTVIEKVAYDVNGSGVPMFLTITYDYANQRMYIESPAGTVLNNQTFVYFSGE